MLPIVCVIAYGEMRGCFEYFEVVDGFAMIWLKGVLLFVLDCLKWACVFWLM